LPESDPVSGSLLAVAAGNGLIVAVGGVSGCDDPRATRPSTIYTSTDGVVWTDRSVVGYTACLTGIVWTGSLFVVVSKYGALTSPDAITWTWRGTMVGLTAVTWTGNQLVGVGPQGQISTSPDGISWTTRQSKVSSKLNAVSVVGNGQLVAVGNNGVILTSRQGFDWEVQVSGTTKNLISVIWAGNKVIVVGDGVILLSP
jgi:hypothetical protein